MGGLLGVDWWVPCWGWVGEWFVGGDLVGDRLIDSLTGA